MKRVIEAVKACRFAKKRPTKAHIIQSLVAGVYILLVFLLLHVLRSELAVTSIGASTFIAFCSPKAKSSMPRILIGGYCIGILSGFLCGGISVLIDSVFSIPGYIISCAVAVFFSMLLMTVLDFEHPPSAALAIAVTIDDNPVIISAAGLGCILVLCILKELLKKRLENLE